MTRTHTKRKVNPIPHYYLLAVEASVKRDHIAYGINRQTCTNGALLYIRVQYCCMMMLRTLSAVYHTQDFGQRKYPSRQQ